MNPAPGKVGGSTDVTLPARLRQISGIDHRLRIGRGQNVVNPMTARTIRDYFRSELRSQSVVAGLVTADTFARYAKLLRECNPFMTLSAALGAYRDRRRPGILLKRHFDIVNAVAIGADRRARNAPSNRLAVDARREFVRFSFVALPTGPGNVDFED